MNMTDVFNGIGSCFQWSFGIIKGLGNIPNLFFWLLIVSLIIVWLRMQSKLNKEAEENGTLK
jgi:phage shock protein PspC (stress-responsive transcriptional regulator)